MSLELYFIQCSHVKEKIKIYTFDIDDRNIIPVECIYFHTRAPMLCI